MTIKEYYGTADVGKPKAAVAAVRLRDLNPDTQCSVHAERADARNLREWLAHYDVVVDCTHDRDVATTLEASGVKAVHLAEEALLLLSRTEAVA